MLSPWVSLSNLYQSVSTPWCGHRCGNRPPTRQELQHPWDNRGVSAYFALLFPLTSAVLIPADCAPWACRPFFERKLLCFFQKSFCSRSSSETRTRPISKCILRFSSHSFSVEKSGLKVEAADMITIRKRWKLLTLLWGKMIYLWQTSDRLSASRSQHTAAIGKKAGGQSGGQ